MYKYKGLNGLKKTQSIWNMLNYFRTKQKLAAYGQEIQGIVIKQGINNKTVTVRGWWRYWENKSRKVRHTANSYQVHDEDNYCRIGDIVVIKQCGSMSKKKGYFVRNVVHQASRFELLNANNLDEIVSSNYYREGEKKKEEDERFQAMLERIQHIKNLGMFDIDKNNQENTKNKFFFNNVKKFNYDFSGDKCCWGYSFRLLHRFSFFHATFTRIKYS